MHGQKSLLLVYNVPSFLPYFLNDSQTICSTIHFSNPLLCMTLICDDWYDLLLVDFIMPVMPDKAAFVSAVLLCVQPLPGKPLFYCSKAAPSVKE